MTDSEMDLISTVVVAVLVSMSLIGTAVVAVLVSESDHGTVVVAVLVSMSSVGTVVVKVVDIVTTTVSNNDRESLKLTTVAGLCIYVPKSSKMTKIVENCKIVSKIVEMLPSFHLIILQILSVTGDRSKNFYRGH